jgi:phosphoheptose isomerase
MLDSDRRALLAHSHIRLSGTVDQEMYESFRRQLEVCPDNGPIVVTISTLGGDPEVARVMGDDVRLANRKDNGGVLVIRRPSRFPCGAP